MIENIAPVENLQGLARAKARDYENNTVPTHLVEDYKSKGWTIEKENEKSVRMWRKKTHSTNLEDRVWTLLYKMGFSYLSGNRGAIILVNPKDPVGPKTQIDIVGLDDEIAIAIECKSSEKNSKRPQFQDELGKHSLIRPNFANAIVAHYPTIKKKQTVLAMFMENILLSDNDRQRAKEANVILFDSADLDYYEKLVAQIGRAAKYQFFSDMLPGKQIQGLRIKVPAVRTKMGGVFCYAFSISPQYLLKISFVSHRSKGKDSDVDKYQRMLTKSKLNQIKEYITNDGIFPTNIVVNLDKECLQFQRIQQDDDPHVDPLSGTLGWLEIRPTYKSAWIIDGQHRLFAYSDHKNAETSLLSVLAFEGLLPSRQAELFIDINSKQKRVKQSLLQELYAALHWDSEDDRIKVRAIISRAIQDLDMDADSPFYQRIQSSDDTKSPLRCISLASIFGAIEKKRFYIAKEKQGHVIEYGPLWAGDGHATLKRTVYILKNWFNLIRNATQDWWDKGSSEGGGLAMNDSVITCINVLLSVFDHLDGNGQKLVHLDNPSLLDTIRKYGEVLGQYLGSLNDDERKKFRSLRGIQGQNTRTRHCQQYIRNHVPNFNPHGLDEFLETEKTETNSKVKECIGRIEIKLQTLIVEELRRAFGPDESGWWVQGVPKEVRLKVTESYEKNDGKRGGKEFYFDLIHYKKIAMENWNIFEPILAYEKKGNKDIKTSWIDYLNDHRNIVSHSSSQVTLSIEVLNKIEHYEEWLTSQISTLNATDNNK